MENMKLTITMLILLLICVSFVLMGCVQEDYSAAAEPGFNQLILQEKNSSIEKQPTFIEFKDEMQEYKSFSDELFPVWLDHINKTSRMLEDFNSSTVLEEKIKKSVILEQKYAEFKVNLESIEPPSIAEGAYSLAVESVSYRILFFKKFNENAPIKELDEIEGQAYLAETDFWVEIDKIYTYFDEEIGKVGTVVGTMGDSKYMAFN
jgi:hypothetical protein